MSTYYHTLRPEFTTVTVTYGPADPECLPGCAVVRVTGNAVNLKASVKKDTLPDLLRMFFTERPALYTFYGGERTGRTLSPTYYSGTTGTLAPATPLLSETGTLTTLGALQATCKTTLV